MSGLDVAVAGPEASLASLSSRPRAWVIGICALCVGASLLWEGGLAITPAQYLHVHTALEFLSLAIATMVVVLGWNLRDSRDNSPAVLLAAVFLYVGLVDFAHVQSFAGMPDFFTPNQPEKSIDLTLAGRLALAVGLLGIALSPTQRWSPRRCLAAFGIALAAAVLTLGIVLYRPGWLPRTFIAGQGPTGFRMGGQYLLAGVYVLATLMFFQQDKEEYSGGSHWLGAAACTQALANLLFNLDTEAADILSLLGHFYKVAGAWMIHRAMFAIGVHAPIHALEQEEKQLKQLVEERTADLNATAARFRIFVEQAPTAIAMFDNDMNYLAVSRRWLLEYGNGLDSLTGHNHYWLYPKVPQRWKRIFREAMAGTPQENQLDLLISPRGRRQWIRWGAYPWRDDRGRIGGITMAVEDITELKAAEERLLESEAHFRAAFEQAGVGVCHATTDGRFLRVNDKYCAILGYERDELLRLRFQDITYPEDVGSNLEGRARLLAGDLQSFSMEKRYIRSDGAVVWVNLTIALVRDAAGEPDYFLAVVEDIQERKAVEQALGAERKAREALLEQKVAERTADLMAANQQLEGFLYAASHDLKAPLGRIGSFSTLLEKTYRDRLEGNGLLFLDFIRENALRLTKLIDDLLAHASVDQRATRLEPVDLHSVVQATIQAKAEDIRETGAVIRLDLPAAQVLADRYGLIQVLQNLLENALKYSAAADQPVIEIGGHGAAGNFRLSVRDNGIGFDMEYHDRIFEIFRRLHTYAEYPGSGIGLALVKRAMERMGGRVWAESHPGNGATFFLELRSAPAG